jgi:glycerol uptake facilitator-like aquaporin
VCDAPVGAVILSASWKPGRLNIFIKLPAAKSPAADAGLPGVSLAFGLSVLTASYALGPMSSGPSMR